MSLFDEASLVVTPNGVKAGKLYSIKPTDGSGDLDAVRATNATRVDENRLVEKPRTNLLLRSEEFDNAYWINNGVTITANAIISPDGTQNADLLTGTAGGFGVVRFSTFTATNKVASCFAKKGSSNIFKIANVSAGNRYVLFDLNNGTVFEQSAGWTGYIEDYGNGWYRCTAISNNETGTFSLGVTAVSESVYIWGAQLETGVSATEYIPTTSVIRTRFAGITQDGGSASNIPRLDYSNGTCPSILVEPQRTNVLTYSEQFDDASWNLNNSTITSNSVLSPDGTLSAETITSTNGALTTSTIFKNSASVTVGQNITLSIFAKSGTHNIIRLAHQSSSSGAAWFDLNLGQVLTTRTGVVAKIMNYGNGWYRCSISLTATTNSAFSYLFGLSASDGSTSPSATGTNAYIWGAQLEASSYATSYIPTVASAVTRNADVISKTGLSGSNTITETFEDDTTNLIADATTYTMSEGRIKLVTLIEN